MRNIAQLLILVFMSLMLMPVSPSQADERRKDQYLVKGLSPREPAEPTELMIQPNGPFAVMVFDESALSEFIGIIYYRPMTDPGNGAWRIDDRFWQKADWAGDVTSFAWGKSGKYLYVGTANVYGDGGLFKLDLLNRTSMRIFPSEDTLKKTGLLDRLYATEITSVDLQRVRMTIELSPLDDEDIKRGLKVLRQEMELQ